MDSSIKQKRSLGRLFSPPAYHPTLLACLPICLTARRKCLLPPCVFALDSFSPVAGVVAEAVVVVAECSSSSLPAPPCPYAVQRAWSVGSRHVARLPRDHAVGYSHACLHHYIPKKQRVAVWMYIAQVGRGGRSWARALVWSKMASTGVRLCCYDHHVLHFFTRDPRTKLQM